MKKINCTKHCESVEWLWLQGEVASQTHSFRDAEPHPVIPQNVKKKYGIFLIQPRPGISTSLSTTNLCLPSAAWQWSVVGYYRICQLGPRCGTEYSLQCIGPCLTVWLCLKMGSENMLLIRPLHIGAKDLTVQSTFTLLFFFYFYSIIHVIIKIKSFDN